MADQEARYDPNAQPAMIAHSSVSSTAETRQVVATNGQVWTTSNSYSAMMDISNTGTIFLGYTDVGFATAVADPVWAIKRVVTSGGSVPLASWAGGSLDRVNVWDNRTTLDYS